MEAFMNQDFIRVHCEPNLLWSVNHGLSAEQMEGFKHKGHAVAYARALSHSLHLDLYVDDKLGYPIEQSAASLTYPVILE